MNSVALKSKKNKRYLPHEVTTKVYSVKLYRQTKDIDLVCRRYHISKASLMRWNKLYDGTKESLMPKSHRPHSQHPNGTTVPNGFSAPRQSFALLSTLIWT